MARHFKHDIHAETSGFLHDHGARIFFCRIDHVIRLHLLRNLPPVFVNFNDENRGRTHGPRHRDGKQSDGAGASDGNSFGRDFSGKHGVHGVSQWIKNRGVLQRDGGIQFPDIRFRDDHVFGEGAVGVHANDFHVLANVGFAGATLQTFSACHMHLG